MSLSKSTLSRLGTIGAAAAVLVLAGCASSTRVEPPAPVENRGGAASVAPAVSPNAPQTGGAGGSGVTPVDTGRSADAGSAVGRVVYFDFDSFVVKDEYRGVVEGHARRLGADRKRRMVVEGHTDERGGREYNLALGQKRADAVVKSLVLLGAQDGQLEAVSFGEERPAAQGTDEAAWTKNRRAELKDR